MIEKGSNMIEKYNILSWGILTLDDLDLLHKQFELFTKYSKIPFDFYVMPGREAMLPHVNMVEDIKNSLPKNYNCITSNYLNDNKNIMQNLSIFAGYALNDFFNSAPLGKYFIVHNDCLPIKTFNINDWAKDVSLFCISQKRNDIVYAWENMCFIDTNVISPKEINFCAGMFEGGFCDTGGGTYKMLQKYLYYCYGHTTKYLNNIDTILLSDISEFNKNILLKNYEIQTEELGMCGNVNWSELYFFDTFFHHRSFSGWNRKTKTSIEIKNKRKTALLELK